MKLINSLKNWWLKKTTTDPDEMIPVTTTYDGKTTTEKMKTRDADSFFESFFGERPYGTKKEDNSGNKKINK